MVAGRQPICIGLSRLAYPRVEVPTLAVVNFCAVGLAFTDFHSYGSQAYPTGFARVLAISADSLADSVE